MDPKILAHLESHIALTQDFPEPPVLFRDISPLLTREFRSVVDCMVQLIPQDMVSKIDAFGGLDARGFIFAGALAGHFNKGVLMIRKKGKLPPPVFDEDYMTEYGQRTLELKAGEGKVFLLDDVLATGGSMKAAANLCTHAGYTVQGFATLMDLKFLNDFEWNGMKNSSIFAYERPDQILYPVPKPDVA
ncbi:MAG: adenine phosphoribosyltransferase [Alphaproteobacteria bacterium]|nr:adenine phosphoribosyltransferase [Alphaproteobacteria bacterium]